MIVTFLLQLFIVTLMLSLSFQITAQDIFHTLQRSRLIISSLLANFLFIPFATYFFTEMIDIPRTTAFTLFLASVAPGAAFAPKLVAIACGDLSAAVSLTFILSILAVVVTPLAVQLAYFSEGNLLINVMPIVGSLILFQLLPLIVGFVIHHRNKALVKQLLRPVEFISDILFVSLLVIFLFNKFSIIFNLEWLSIVAIIGFNVSTLVIGWKLGNFKAYTQKSLIFTTGSRNLALMLLVAIKTFPQTDIETTVIAFGLVEVIINLLVSFYCRRSYDLNI
ncbi:bile acid:sodium symporter family protein [Okeania sp. SIO1I7]|uniref:bile acid:sodium symporter family protein n=1 Tax=Okeania sp. SIO1I7 TaxID=2607772 RepID=UPI0013F6D7D1|nr:bile acid:sodium symporter [Okeania sp. SIO1I7]NET28987.1 hypothetical protein [Okeania sp. SIO1I7]